MALDLAVFQSPTGPRVPLATNQATDVVLSSNAHGYEKAAFTVTPPAGDVFGVYSSALLHVEANDPGCVWKGRYEDPTLRIGADPASLGVAALGYWSALNDVLYTALWSSTSVKDWKEVPDSVVLYQPKRWKFDTDNRLFITPEKGAQFDNVGYYVGGLSVAVPYGSSRAIVGVSFDYELLMPSNWTAQMNTMDSDYTNAVNQWSLTATGAQLNGTRHLVFSGQARVTFLVFYNAASATFGAETGSAYLKITNVRVVTSTLNRITTTLTAARAAGTSVTAPVGSTVGMYAGQQLQIESGTNGETVVVQSVTNATQFVATFARAHASGSAVQAHVISADEIVRDCLASTVAVNPTQISASTALIQSPGLDITDAVYEDRYPADILTQLAAQGDLLGRSWEAQVWEDQRLVFRPQFSAARAWYIDVTSLEVARTLDQVRNSAYAAYQDASGAVLRTATNTDAASVAATGITRRAKVDAQTTNSALATYVRDTSLANTKNPAPRATISLARVCDASGARWPLWAVRAGDTMMVRNLPPSSSAVVDRIRTFRLTRTEYHGDDDTLSVEPELPPALLDAQIAALY